MAGEALSSPEVLAATVEAAIRDQGRGVVAAATSG
jgi:hypothetical protein